AGPTTRTTARRRARRPGRRAPSRPRAAHATAPGAARGSAPHAGAAGRASAGGRGAPPPWGRGWTRSGRGDAGPGRRRAPHAAARHDARPTLRAELGVKTVHVGEVAEHAADSHARPGRDLLCGGLELAGPGELEERLHDRAAAALAAPLAPVQRARGRARRTA